MLVGPYLDLAEYRSLITESSFKGNNKSTRRLPSGRKRVAYFKMFMGFVYLGIFVVFGGQYNFSSALTPWFAEQGMFTRIALFQLYGVFERCKYYAIWTLTEAWHSWMSSKLCLK